MKTTTTTWWRCMHPDCGASGVYEQALSGGAADKHTRASGHPTTSSIRGPIPATLVPTPDTTPEDQ
jgi:hypothetical protein